METDVIRAIIRAVDLVLPDITKRIEFVAGIISEIHEPAETMDAIPPGTPVESNEVKVMVRNSFIYTCSFIIVLICVCFT